MELNISVESLSRLPDLDCARGVINSLDGIGWFEEPYQNLKTTLTYPLSVEVEMEFDDVEHIADILYPVAKMYEHIYEVESKTSKLSEKIPENSMLLNRPKTDGEFGVWGHDIGDLRFEVLEIENGIIKLFIGS